MRFLKNIFLAAALSFAFISCEDKGANPDSNPYLNGDDQVGADIGTSIIHPSYELLTIHSDSDWNDNTNRYYYGFTLILPLSDTSKRNLVAKMSITLIDANMKSVRHEVIPGEFINYYDNSVGVYRIGLFSPGKDMSYTSSEYACKVRLYNSNNDSTVSYPFMIKTENYIKPELLKAEWPDQIHLKVLHADPNVAFPHCYAYISFHDNNRYDLGFTPWVDIKAGSKYIQFESVPSDAAYYQVNLADDFNGIKRYYSSKLNAIPKREFENINQIILEVNDVDIVEYIEKTNSFIAISREYKEAALFDGIRYWRQWKTSLPEHPEVCRYDDKTNLIYIMCSSGSIYALDPTTGNPNLVTKWENIPAFLDIEDGYFFMANKYGDYACYNRADGSMKTGSFKYNSGDLRVENVKYNSAVKRAYVISNREIYSFSLDLSLGEASYIKHDALKDRVDVWGGPALFLSPSKNKIISGWGAVYYCSSDTSADLEYFRTIHPFDEALWDANSSSYITASQRYWDQPPNFAIYDLFFNRLMYRTDLAGVPIKAVYKDNIVKVFLRYNMYGEIAVQKFSLNGL